MDEAIAAAEREANAAANKALAAQEQLVEWSDGEKSVIAQLKKIGAVIQTPEFAAVTNGFVEQHSHVFEFTEENKFEYSALHEQYVELMEKTLLDLVKDINMDQLITNLPEFMQSRTHSKDPEGTGSTIDFLLSLTEFETFKTMMLASKQEAASFELGDAGAANDSTLDAIVGNLKIDPVVVNRARVLLQLGANGADVPWKKVGEKPGSYLLEMTELAHDRFMRVNSVIGLSLEHALAAHCNWADPDLKKFDDMWNEITVLKESRHGTVHDSVYTLGLKLPGVIKFVSSIPKTLTMRCVVERDAPKPGSAIAMWVSWDVQKDCPETGALGFVRVALLESTGANSVRFVNVSKMAPVMPSWVAGLFMSKTVMSGMLACTEKYKKLHGLA